MRLGARQAVGDNARGHLHFTVGPTRHDPFKVQVQLDPTKLDLFINSMRKIFLLMGIFSLVAAVPSWKRGPRDGKGRW